MGNQETLLLFSDTYIGEVKDGKPMPGNVMVNNTVAIVQGNSANPDSIQFYYKRQKRRSATFFVPQNTGAEAAFGSATACKPRAGQYALPVRLPYRGDGSGVLASKRWMCR
ncbi:MAG: hypothetical protein IPN76_26485 [Saprospiraceae bacterium]|nr:hypothetical protein [Saprospiraceae bacterium]